MCSPLLDTLGELRPKRSNKFGTEKRAYENHRDKLQKLRERLWMQEEGNKLFFTKSLYPYHYFYIQIKVKREAVRYKKIAG